MLQPLRLQQCSVSHFRQGGTRIERPFSSDPRPARRTRQTVQSKCSNTFKGRDQCSTGQLLSGVFAGAALLTSSSAVPDLAWAEPNAPAEAAAQQSAPVSSAQQDTATAPPVSSAAGPQQPAAPSVSPAQQPGVRSDAAAKLRSEVDALLKQPPPAIPPSAPATPASQNAQPDNGSTSTDAVKQSLEGQQAATKEEVSKSRGRKKGRIRELEEIRSELAEKELVLLGKEKELLDKDQTVQVLREELEIERKLRGLLTKDKQKAEEEAALAIGLCRSVP